jgi:hypothetical protein
MTVPLLHIIGSAAAKPCVMCETSPQRRGGRKIPYVQAVLAGAIDWSQVWPRAKFLPARIAMDRGAALNPAVI